MYRGNFYNSFLLCYTFHKISIVQYAFLTKPRIPLFNDLTNIFRRAFSLWRRHINGAQLEKTKQLTPYICIVWPDIKGNREQISIIGEGVWRKLRNRQIRSVADVMSSAPSAQGKTRLHFAQSITLQLT